MIVYANYDADGHQDVFDRIRDVLMPDLAGVVGVNKTTELIAIFCETLVDARPMQGFIPTAWLDGTLQAQAPTVARANSFMTRIESEGVVTFVSSRDRTAFVNRMAAAAEGCLNSRPITRVLAKRLEPKLRGTSSIPTP